jgi:hypothetical protein
MAPVEVQRAIYIDFEGFVKEAPSLLGISVDGAFKQVVLDAGLKAAAEFSGLEFLAGKAAISGLLRQAINEERRIVAFSSHEKAKAKEWYEIDLEPVYADARMIAKRWLNALKQKHPDWEHTHPRFGKVDNTLKSFLELIDYPRSSHLGLRKSTKRIGDVRDMLANRNTFEDLTGVAKRKWTNLLSHNQIDVEGMRDLVGKASAGFEPRAIE